MGTYYAFVNDTKKKAYHVGSYINNMDIRYTHAVQMAFINVMMDNMFDSFRMVADYAMDVADDYERINLLTSVCLNDDIHERIVYALCSVDSPTDYRQYSRVKRDANGNPVLLINEL
jgi:hypothetical protein